MPARSSKLMPSLELGNFKAAPMKILYLNPSSHLGGAERNLIDTICAARQQDPTIKPIVLITAHEGPLVTELTHLGVEVVLLELPSKIARLGDSGSNEGDRQISSIVTSARNISLLSDLWRYRSQLHQTIVAIAPDAIHSNGMKTHLLVASLRLSVPIIWHLHDFIGSRLLIKQLLRLFVDRVTVAIAISQAIADDWQAVFPKLPIELIYNAVDTDRYRLLPLVAVPSPAPSTIKIGLVATYALWKGHDIFIQAIGHLARQHPELKSTVKFYIIGGAIYQTARSQYSREELHQLARSANVEDWIEFIDFQSDIVSSYNRLDIVVHASTQPEPFGRTIVEAMACEKAVIVANAGGAAELFVDRETAIGVTPGDPLALAAALLETIAHPATRLAIGKAGRISAIERFSCNRLGSELTSLYHKIDRRSGVIP
jgi:glycosyltransferase involved in cell wall biosynthesis